MDVRNFYGIETQNHRPEPMKLSRILLKGAEKAACPAFV
jgi:hypothetical protein